MLRRGLALALSALVLLLVVAGLGAWGARRLSRPVSLAEAVVVHITPGSGAAATAHRLEEAGVVRWAPAFRWTTWKAGTSRRLQAGEYRFAGETSLNQVMQRLVRGDVLLHPVTLPEGLTLGETRARLLEAIPELQGDLDAELRRGERVADLAPGATDLEGFLFPDTYRFPRGANAEAVVGALLDRFRKVSSELMREAPVADVRAWVTLASLVEAETGQAGERGRVAGVFANRLRKGMLLQCDPTVIYALERAGKEWQGSLARQLDFDHPYNTYRHPGLPPGPIGNPGRAALLAALQPEATDALYFVADGSGGHRFSNSLKEHNAAVRAWREVRQAQER